MTFNGARSRASSFQMMPLGSGDPFFSWPSETFAGGNTHKAVSAKAAVMFFEMTIEISPIRSGVLNDNAGWVAFQLTSCPTAAARGYRLLRRFSWQALRKMARRWASAGFAAQLLPQALFNCYWMGC